jgi:flagellar hook-associated protein 1
MSTLFGTMSIATGALGAEQGALDATTNNVANVNTPGYSRLHPVLVESDPVVLGPITYGTGVSLEKLQSLRDPILQLRIQQETQQEGQLNGYVSAMQQAQVQFTSSSGDIGTLISNFFSSLSQLSTDPTSLALRQGVLTAAGNMATAFNNTANTLTQQRSSLDQQVSQDVSQVNVLTSQIAALNNQISQMEGVNQDPSALIDQRDVLIGQLSSLIDVSSIQSDNGLTLTTSNGTALVVGGQSFALSTQTNASGMQDIYAQGTDITSKLTSGQLAGLIQARDQSIPGLLSNLDTLAAGLANALNTANQTGFDLNGNPGANLFVPPSVSGQGAAANLAVAITDPTLIAGSSDGTPGSNGNVAVLSAVQDQPIARLALNLNEQDSPAAAGRLALGDVLTVGGTTKVTAGGTTFSYTNAITNGANLNEVTSANAVTSATALASGDVVTATRGGETTIYTATAATTVGNLITAINRGVTGPVAGTNITISGSDPQPNNYQAVLVGGNLQIVDLNGNNDLSVAQSTGSELGVFTTNAAATSTLQDLINAINGDATVGAKAALVNGKLEITDPLGRGNLGVTTTDTVLGAAVAGSSTNFATPDLSSGQTPTDYYSNTVFGVGNDVSNGSAELNSSQLILNQLNDQRGSISGVSLDEEAANMVQYQRAFDAAAQVVTTINDMPRSCAEAGILKRVVPLNDIPAVILQATRYRKRA